MTEELFELSRGWLDASDELRSRPVTDGML